MEDITRFLPAESPVQQGKSLHLDCPSFADKFPYVNALLASSLAQGDKFRYPASITLFVADGHLKACVSDKHTAKSLFVTLDIGGPFWEQIEAYVANHPDEWKGKVSKVLPKKG